MKNNINLQTKKDIQITREHGHSIIQLKNGQYFKVDKLTSDLLSLLKDSNWTVNTLVTKLQKMGHKVSEDGWRGIISKLKGKGFFIGEAEKIKSEYWFSFRIFSGKALSAMTSVFTFLFNPFVGVFFYASLQPLHFSFLIFFSKILVPHKILSL